LGEPTTLKEADDEQSGVGGSGDLQNLSRSGC